jgi:phage-related tail protein
MTTEDLRNEAARSMAGSGDIRERVRELTLAAFRERKFDFAAMREVMQQVSDGISLGAEHRGEDLRQALGDAYKGMDEAVSKSVQATRLALEEVASKGREINDTEVRAALGAMKRLEQDMLSTLSGTAQRAGARVKSELEELASHAARAGTDTGAVITRTMTDFSQQLARTAGDATSAGVEAAKAMGERLAEATSGFLAGLSEAMSRKDQPRDK